MAESGSKGEAPATVHRAEVNGLHLSYRRAGSGEPLVLLHGFPETSFAWRNVMPLLAERFTVIAPDLRGCGASDRPDDGYDKAAVAADVRELIRHLGFERIDLVSHDVGMMVGYAYASAYPPNGLAEALLGGRERMFVEHFMRQQAYNQDGITAEALDEYARCLRAPGALHAGIAYFRAHRVDAEHNRRHAAQRLPMPVMTVGGDASFGAALKVQIEPLVERLRHVMIPECGHYLAEEQPVRLAHELLQFFAA